MTDNPVPPPRLEDILNGADFVEVASASDWKKIGTVGVDSGTIAIHDPATDLNNPIPGLVTIFDSPGGDALWHVYMAGDMDAFTLRFERWAR